MSENLISLREYAEALGLDPSTVRQKALRGYLPGAVKIGRNWVIPKGTPYPDARVKSGLYRDWRKKQ